MTSLHADESFLEYFQLPHDPFAPRVPGFKFFPAQRKSVLAQLHHLARYSQLLLLICGPEGSGKTLLRQALVASSNKQAVLSVVLPGQDAANRELLLKRTARELGAAGDTLQQVLSRAGELALAGQEVYLLVDDAGQLQDAALDALMELAAGAAGARLHVFLFAEDDLALRMEKLASGEERFHLIELQPYSLEQTREYLALRLEGAGQDIELFSDEQIQEIQKRSRGWPGAINQCARDLLVEFMLAEQSAEVGNASRFPRKHLLALMVIVLAVAAAFMLQDRDDSPSAVTDPAQVDAGAESIATPAVPSGAVPAIEFSGTQKVHEPAEVQPVIREPLAQAGGVEEVEEQGGAKVDVSGAESVPSEEQLAKAESARIQALPLPPATPPVTAAPVLPAAQPVQPASAVVTAVQPPREVAPPAPAASVKPSQAVPSGAAQVNAWHLQQAGSRFTLQVLGSRSQASAQDFARQNGADFRYFVKMHQGQPLYVVTYGVFSDRAAAQAAIKTLPAKAQAGNPWPKSFATIQQEIAQAR
jgi:DamX protein